MIASAMIIYSSTSCVRSSLHRYTRHEMRYCAGGLINGATSMGSCPINPSTDLPMAAHSSRRSSYRAALFALGAG